MNMRCGGLMLLYMVDSKALVCWGDDSSCFFFCFPCVSERERDWFTRNRGNSGPVAPVEYPPPEKREETDPIQSESNRCFEMVIAGAEYVRTGRPAEKQDLSLMEHEGKKTCWVDGPWFIHEVDPASFTELCCRPSHLQQKPGVKKYKMENKISNQEIAHRGANPKRAGTGTPPSLGV